MYVERLLKSEAEALSETQQHWLAAATWWHLQGRPRTPCKSATQIAVDVLFARTALFFPAGLAAAAAGQGSALSILVCSVLQHAHPFTPRSPAQQPTALPPLGAVRRALTRWPRG